MDKYYYMHKTKSSKNCKNPEDFYFSRVFGIYCVRLIFSVILFDVVPGAYATSTEVTS